MLEDAVRERNVRFFSFGGLVGSGLARQKDDRAGIVEPFSGSMLVPFNDNEGVSVGVPKTVQDLAIGPCRERAFHEETMRRTPSS